MSETAEVKKKDMKDVLAAAEAYKCAVQRAFTFVDEFLSEPMCGRCLPCSLGSYEAKVRLQRISAGSGTDEDISALHRIASQMLVGSMCKKGKDTGQFIQDSLAGDTFSAHASKKCAARECASLVVYRVIAEKCVMCGLCQDACKYNAIAGEKKVSYQSGFLPFEVRQRRCTKCGDCLKACPYGAIEVIEETMEAVI